MFVAIIMIDSCVKRNYHLGLKDQSLRVLLKGAVIFIIEVIAMEHLL